MNVPKTFWLDVVQTTTYLMNHLPTRVLGYQTPLEVLFPNSTLFLILLKVFGCICFVHVDKSVGSKLDPKALKCIFLGYSPNQKEYKCFHPSTRKNFVSKDVTFHESVPFFCSNQSLIQGECVTSVDVDPLLVPVFLFYHGALTKDCTKQ